ncbi:MAG: hypothetical protein M3540_09780 [Actinomycetota bacterium]|nr:hypothetical protein [Actinomycetota bacterium]
MTADVDGDGRPDRVFIARDKDRQSSCPRFLVVDGAQKVATAIRQPELTSRVATETLKLPRLEGVVEVGGGIPPLPVVWVIQGASTGGVAVYRAGGGSLSRVRIGKNPWVGGALPFGGSAAFGSGVDCVNSRPGQIVASARHLDASGRRWIVDRTFFRLTDMTLDVSATGGSASLGRGNRPRCLQSSERTGRSRLA